MKRDFWSGEHKYRAILAVVEAANAHLDLSGVLDAVASALTELVPLDLIALQTWDGDSPRMIGAHLGESPRRAEEATDAYYARVTTAEERENFRDELKYSLDRLERERVPIVIDDVNAETSLPLAALIRRGGRVLALFPLIARSGFVGSLACARMTPAPFMTDEIQVLDDISRLLGGAVANALAYEEIARLRARLEEENVALQEEIAAATNAGGIIGSSPAVHAMLDRLSRVAATDATVLVTGETGTGKELVARTIHATSQRRTRALIKVNCAALPDGLIASELFGHERGAFTGATERRRGRFELAAGGTIFLDEIGELPAQTQVALLRVVQEGEFERVGGTETLRTDARIVAATNRDLEEAVREGKFREDLLFRLNVFPIRVPPLRERADDIPVIAEYYASQYSRKIGKKVRGIGERAMEALIAYPWPGNIRELQNLVERAVSTRSSNGALPTGPAVTYLWFFAARCRAPLAARRNEGCGSERRLFVAGRRSGRASSTHGCRAVSVIRPSAGARASRSRVSSAGGGR